MKVNIYLQMLQEFFNCFLSMIKLLIELKEFMQSKSAGHIFRISENRNGFLILLILKGEFYRALNLRATADCELIVFILKRVFGCFDLCVNFLHFCYPKISQEKYFCV